MGKIFILFALLNLGLSDSNQNCSGQDGGCTEECGPEDCSPSCPTPCTCSPGFRRVNGVCVKKVYLNGHCVSEVGCQAGQDNSECNSLLHICQCRPGFKQSPVQHGQPGFCIALTEQSHEAIGQVDMAMVMILVGLGAMFAVMCIVFQMFARARFQENRSIFNTPNPRLMNASFSSAKSGRRKSSTCAEEAQEGRRKKLERLKELNQDIDEV